METDPGGARLEIRVHDRNAAPTLVYLPGVHGDWTAVGAFRRALEGRVRFVEFAYPRTTIWTMEDYGAAVLRALADSGIKRGWILGESFGSQVAWALLREIGKLQKDKAFHPEGLILAGGFARHPIPFWPGLGLLLTSSRWMVLQGFRAYRAVVRLGGWRNSKMSGDADEFMRRRQAPGDIEALRHRLRLVARNDPRECAKTLGSPLYCLSGLVDPIVPWPLTFRWFRRNCPALRETKVLFLADHNVLGTAPQRAAEQALRWMGAL